MTNLFLLQYRVISVFHYFLLAMKPLFLIYNVASAVIVTIKLIKTNNFEYKTIFLFPRVYLVKRNRTNPSIRNIHSKKHVRLIVNFY